MKQLSILTLCISLLLASCKRDHPNDIPKWLKQTIKEAKRTGHTHGKPTCVDGSMVISEWKETTTNAKLYAIMLNDPSYYTFYDEQGNEVCVFWPLYCQNLNCNCGNFNIKNMIQTRVIWRAVCN